MFAIIVIFIGVLVSPEPLKALDNIIIRHKNTDGTATVKNKVRHIYESFLN